MKKFVTILLAMILALSLYAPAFAAGGNVTYIDRAEKFIFEPGSKDSPADLFDEGFKGVMPGDTVTEQIEVNNRSKETVRIYMRALGEKDPSTDGFLEQLTLSVKKSGSGEIFNAGADETAQLTDWVLLGTFDSGDKVILDVMLTVPDDLGNEMQNAAGYLDWEFMVEEVPEEDDPVEPPVKPGEPSDPEKPPVDPGEPSDPEKPPVDPGEPSSPGVPDDPADPASGPSGSDEPFPPRTGDESHLSLWIILLIVSAAAVLALLFKRKK